MQEPVIPSPDRESTTWAIILHLSLLSGLLVPMAGLIVPVIIFFLKKDDVPGLVRHGYVIFNWLISLLIYAAIGTLLLVVGIGMLVLLVLGLLALVFPIIAAIKASEGQVWPYPLSIQFFK